MQMDANGCKWMHLFHHKVIMILNLFMILFMITVMIIFLIRVLISLCYFL